MRLSSPNKTDLLPSFSTVASLYNPSYDHETALSLRGRAERNRKKENSRDLVALRLCGVYY